MSKINDLIKELCPNGVEFKSLKEVFDIFSGMKGVTNKWAEEGNCQFIDYMNAYKNNKIDITNLPYATVKNMNQIILAQGDLLLTCASEVPDECAIASVIEDIIQDGVFMDDHLFGLRLKDKYKNTINTTFISYYLNSKPFRCNLFKAVRGVTRFYISNKDYMKLYVPIPPIKVQEEIVRILDKFGELEAELEAELEMRKSQYKYWRAKLFKNVDGERRKLNEVLDYIQPSKYIVSNTEYSNEYNTPVLTAGLSFVLGYTNETSGIYNATKDSPVIIFDDFTTSNHWVDFNFKVKSSAMKLLIPKTDDNFRYIYYAIKNIKYIPKEHSRQWIQTYSNFEIIVPSIKEQNHLVNILDKFDKLVNDISIGLPAEIELRRQQFEYYRNKLLSFEEVL